MLIIHGKNAELLTEYIMALCAQTYASLGAWEMVTPDILPPPAQNQFLFILTDAFIICIFIGATIYWLHNHKKPHQGFDISGMRLSPTIITVAMLLIAVLGPAAFNIYPNIGPWFVYLVGMSWQISSLSASNIMFSATFFLVIAPFMIFRLVFVYQIYKYYRGLTTRKRTVLVGVLGEIQFPVMSLMIIPFALTNPSLAVIFSVPVPILLIAGLVILHFVKVPRPIDGWEELDESPDWWDKQKQSVPEG